MCDFRPGKRYLYCPMRHRPCRPPMLLVVLFVGGLIVAPTGCTRGPLYVAESMRKPIDRAIVDYPGGTRLVEVVRNLTGACDFEEDADGNWIIAESGAGGYDPRIFGFKKDG